MFYFLIHLLVLHLVDSNCISQKRILMNDGNSIPINAQGTFVLRLDDRKYVKQAVINAIESGIRLIDTDVTYLTEDLVGEAIIDVVSRGIVRREDLFISTKVPYDVNGRENVLPSIRRSLRRLQLDYVDLYLIHTPNNVLRIGRRDNVAIWKGFEDVVKQGYAKSIGVSNFNGTEVNELLAKTNTTPAVNQIEVSPTYTDLELVAYCQSQGIVVMGYSAMGFFVNRPLYEIINPPNFNNPVLYGIAKKYGVSSSQIIIRYMDWAGGLRPLLSITILIDRNIIPITGSLNKTHIQLNANVPKVPLTTQEIRIINEFDRNLKVFVGDYPGLFEDMREEYYLTKDYIYKNNLTQYYSSYNA